MKKILFALLVALALVACKMPDTKDIAEAPEATPAPVASPNVHVYNSAWQIVKEATLSANRASRDITTTEGLEAEVTDYNAAHTDDQLTLVVGDEIPIEESPEATAYIVNASTLVIYYEGIVARTDLVERREAWRMSVEAFDDPETHKNVKCTLYIDNIPPEPPVIIPPEPKLWTAVLDITARQVYYSEHFATEAEALHQYRCDCSQADLYNYGDQADGIDVPGHVYEAYIGETEYTFETIISIEE